MNVHMIIAHIHYYNGILSSCIHLLAELCKVDRCRSNVALLLPLLAETTGHRQYIQHCNHMETLMKQVRRE